MRGTGVKLLVAAGLTGMLVLGSCHSSYELARVEGRLIAIDSVWDSRPDSEAVALLKPYKAEVDSVMFRVVGVSEMVMRKGQPESLLSNLVADVIRQAAVTVLGRPADMGVVNLGGLRNILPKGEVTCGAIYEILPFENSLCVVTLRGADLRELFSNIAARGGNGVSGVRLEISAEGRLIEGKIGGEMVEDERFYTVATVDYLADGNDGMEAMVKATKRVCPQGETLRKVFMEYVEARTAEGKKITSRLDGRVTVK